MNTSRTLLALLLLAALAPAQDAEKKKATEGTDGDASGKEQPNKEKPIEGVRILEAIVMKVEGAAQARPEPKAKWKKLERNDVLKPGAVVRTGRKSSVALRVGKNATVLIERHSRVAIPEILQDGDTLKTRLKMQFGKADVKVDRVGLRNDFGVATPTATMAVRGSRAKLIWDPVRGFVIQTSARNRLRAIEVEYANSVLAILSGGDGSSQKYQLPAVQAFYRTYVQPLLGSLEPSETGDPLQSGPTGIAESPIRETGVKAARNQRGNDKVQGVTGGGGGAESVEQGVDNPGR